LRHKHQRKIGGGGGGVFGITKGHLTPKNTGTGQGGTHKCAKGEKKKIRDPVNAIRKKRSYEEGEISLGEPMHPIAVLGDLTKSWAGESLLKWGKATPVGGGAKKPTSVSTPAGASP